MTISLFRDGDSAMGECVRPICDNVAEVDSLDQVRENWLVLSNEGSSFFGGKVSGGWTRVHGTALRAGRSDLSRHISLPRRGSRAVTLAQRLTLQMAEPVRTDARMRALVYLFETASTGCSKSATVSVSRPEKSSGQFFLSFFFL